MADKLNLISLKNTFINQSITFFTMMNNNKKINHYFTTSYYLLSKKFVELQPIKSMELVIKYTHKHYNNLMSFDEAFYKSLNIAEIFEDSENEDDKYYMIWFIKVKSVWEGIPQDERTELIRTFQCMVLTASKYYLLSNTQKAE